MSNASNDIVLNDAIALLQQLIATPSLSRQEDGTAAIIEAFFTARSIPVDRIKNNVYAVSKYYDPAKPSILLNSHHDTVPPNLQYSRDPHDPEISDGKLYGLGSTDAGASLVCLIHVFIYFYHVKELPYNLVIAATAEEEVSGKDGVECLFNQKAFADLFIVQGSFAVVGEPTQLALAIAEKGLMVLDCTAVGKPGHAARNEGDNAVYKAMEAIAWFRTFSFPKQSDLLGAVKMTVTSVETENKMHNVVPGSCRFTVDIRLNEHYTHEEILHIISGNTNVRVEPRSMRLKASSIDPSHPAVQCGQSLGKNIFGSPTMSDQALIPMPSLKCGPGHSAQSHSADEFILISDIRDGMEFYIQWLSKLILG